MMTISQLKFCKILADRDIKQELEENTYPNTYTEEKTFDLKLSINSSSNLNSNCNSKLNLVSPLNFLLTNEPKTTPSIKKAAGKENKSVEQKKDTYKIIYDQKYSGIKKRNTPDDERKQYIISIQNIISDKDIRTTLMIKNIPTCITQIELLKMVNKKYKSAYNFFYLPIDFNKKLNAGYAFINFKTPKLIVSFFEEFDNKPWDIAGYRNKMCYVSYARIQGFKSICDHFYRSNIMKQVDEKLKPIII